MGTATLRLNEREIPWTLVIEPWALAFDIAAGQRGRIDIVTGDEPFNLEMDKEPDDSLFLAFAETEFTVRIGNDVHKYAFGTRPQLFSD